MQIRTITYLNNTLEYLWELNMRTTITSLIKDADPVHAQISSSNSLHQLDSIIFEAE